LAFFLRHGIVHASAADFIFVIQDGKLSVPIPKARNIRVIPRDNSCYDLGAWGAVLQTPGLVIENYKYFVFINSSVRGPFLPAWAPADWLTIFASQISYDVKLVGLSANCKGSLCGSWLRHHEYVHLQSMFLLTDSVGLRILWPLITRCPADRDSAITDVEMQLSRFIQRAGYRWRGQLLGMNYPEYLHQCEHVDVLYDASIPGEPATVGDPVPFHTVHPFETIFFKSNRNVTPALLHSLQVWTDRATWGLDWRQKPYPYKDPKDVSMWDCQPYPAGRQRF
jgi:hypothetical protein